MNYLKIYNNLIKRCKDRTNPDNVYIEIHHIIPESLGGETNEDNLVELSLREHYLAHELLVKIYPNEDKLKYALWMMTITTLSAIKNRNNHRGNRIKDLFEYDKSITISSRQYEYAKECYISAKIGKKYTTKERKNVSLGTIKAMQNKKRLYACAKGSKNTKWYRDKITGKTYKWHVGDPDIDIEKYEWGRGNFFTEEMKSKVSSGQKYPKTWYSLIDTDIVVLYPDDSIYNMPNDNWKIVKQSNNIIRGKSIKEELILIMREFNIITNFKYDKQLYIYHDIRLSKHKNQALPSLYEFLKEIGIKSKLDIINNKEKIINELVINIDNILKESTKYYKK